MYKQVKITLSVQILMKLHVKDYDNYVVNYENKIDICKLVM